MERTERIEWLDTAKAIAIIFVIIGHSFRDSMLESSYYLKTVFAFIYRFHMPLWFFLAGCTYGFNKKKYMAGKPDIYIVSRLKTLIIPYAVYAALMYILFRAAALIPSVYSMLDGSGYGTITLYKYIKASLMGENPYSFHLWFLEALFFISVSVFVIQKYVGSKAVAAAGIAVMVWRLVFDNMPGVVYCWIITALIRNIPWYIAGSFLVFYIKIPCQKGSKAFNIIFVTASYIFMLLRITALAGYMSNTALRILIQAVEYAAAAGIIYSVILFSAIIRGKIKSAFQKLGKNSYNIYLLHQPACAFSGVILYDKMGLPAILVLLFCTVQSVVLPWIVVKLIRMLRLEKPAKLLNIK